MAASLRVRIPSLLLAVLPFLLAGCTRKWEADGAQHFAYEWWVGMLTLVSAAGLIVIGWMIRTSWERTGYTMMIGGVACLVITPGYFLDFVKLTDQGFAYRSGSILIDSGEIKFEDLGTVSLTTTVSRGRRGRKNTTHHMICQMKNGAPIDIEMTELVRFALPAIDQIAAQKGIAVIDQRER